MNRKALRCGVLALLLAALLALPAMATTAGSRVPRPPRPAAERGFLGSLWEHLVDLVAGVGGAPRSGGLAHLLGANRGGIDPNGAPTQSPPTGDPTNPSGDDGDNRGGIDPNG